MRYGLGYLRFFVSRRFVVSFRNRIIFMRLIVILSLRRLLEYASFLASSIVSYLIVFVVSDSYVEYVARE